MADPVAAVCFDLDSTLCEHPVSHGERLAGAFERAGVEPFFEVEDYGRKLHEFDGVGSDVRLRERCFRALAEERDRDPDRALRVADAYEALSDRTAVEFLPGAERVLEAFGDRYRLGLVTNGGPDTQSAKIDALGLREHVATVVMGGYHTAAKPDGAPLRRAMADLGVEPGETVYVGNSIHHDVGCAAAAGARSVLLERSRPEDPGTDREPDHRIGALEELLPPPWASGT